MTHDLTDSPTLDARRALLAAPRMAPLVHLAAAVRERHGATPDFDPLDGGPDARLLLLLETPGPRIGRTGFVSLDNPSGTSRNLRRFLHAAGIGRDEMVLWNAVPWVIHSGRNRAPRTAEIAAGREWLPALLGALPRLGCAVLAGRVAAGARPTLHALRPDLPALTMPHPSPTIVCTSPAIPARIAACLALAARMVRGTEVS